MQDAQLFELLGKSQRILVALPANPNGDTLGGSLALAEFLKKMNKRVEIFCQKTDFGNLSFLPGISEIKHEIVFAKSFVISLKTDSAKLDELSYNVLPDRINIYLKPKDGSFNENNISYSAEFPGYDLIVCVDTPTLESLGALYEKNAEMFFQAAKVNIDNHINNNNYGTINIVDVTASSTSEILLDLLKQYEASLIDENIATNLLTGIISETNSFQHNKTTPNSFLKASELISYGAKQQEIIRNLFKTKDLPILKLWGRAMARLKELPEFSAMFSAVDLKDVEKSQADDNIILKVAEDFAASTTDSKVAFLVVERPDQLSIFVSANPNIKLEELVNFFGGEFISEALAKVVIKGRSITESEQVISEALKELKPRLGL
jgi:nanoRNase/pAp phosphatase (c-di-AMP/oligoRNAs hydrolase)